MDAQRRYQFFEFVRDRWGPARAGDLMDMLPPAGAEELVTKDLLRSELSVFRAEMREEFALIRQEMAEQRAELLDKMRSDTRMIMVSMFTMWASTIAVVVALYLRS